MQPRNHANTHRKLLPLSLKTRRDSVLIIILSSVRARILIDFYIECEWEIVAWRFGNVRKWTERLRFRNQ